jgi:hypothetical protein
MCEAHRCLEEQGPWELTSFVRLITMLIGQCSRYTRCGLFPALQDIFISCLLGRLLKGMLVASYLLLKHHFICVAVERANATPNWEGYYNEVFRQL